MVARVVPQSARRRHAESRKPDLWGWAARPKAPVLCKHTWPGLFGTSESPVRWGCERARGNDNKAPSPQRGSAVIFVKGWGSLPTALVYHTSFYYGAQWRELARPGTKCSGRRS